MPANLPELESGHLLGPLEKLEEFNKLKDLLFSEIHESGTISSKNRSHARLSGRTAGFHKERADRNREASRSRSRWLELRLFQVTKRLIKMQAEVCVEGVSQLFSPDDVDAHVMEFCFDDPEF